MRSRVPTLKLVVGLALALAVVAGGWRAVVAFNPQPEPPAMWNSSPLTLTAAQYAQVNVAYVADPADFRHPPEPGRVQIQFYDGTGRLLQETMMELAPGQATSLRYTPGRVIGGDGAPSPDTLVRARVRILNRTRGGVTASMEIGSQATLSTLFAMPGEWVGFNPQPEPPAAGVPGR
jgi:hypothetical protein